MAQEFSVGNNNQNNRVTKIIATSGYHIIQDDLVEVFDLLDPNRTNIVDAMMFATELYKMKTHEMSTSVSFIKHYTEAKAFES